MGQSDAFGAGSARRGGPSRRRDAFPRCRARVARRPHVLAVDASHRFARRRAHGVGACVQDAGRQSRGHAVGQGAPDGAPRVRSQREPRRRPPNDPAAPLPAAHGELCPELRGHRRRALDGVAGAVPVAHHRHRRARGGEHVGRRVDRTAVRHGRDQGPAEAGQEAGRAGQVARQVEGSVRGEPDRGRQRRHRGVGQGALLRVRVPRAIEPCPLQCPRDARLGDPRDREGRARVRRGVARHRGGSAPVDHRRPLRRRRGPAVPRPARAAAARGP
mmetsp:Transcript_29272/g.90473  ORF Transcript_29272/g.90473 Transcript_29272/m.90473 type:complete len:274 (+) Transcript_29272:796-1617(+)